jgi:RNA polymerase sigma factor (sigma-70 family)
VGAADGESKRLDSVPELPERLCALPDTSAAEPDRSQALAEIYRKQNAALVRFLAVRTGSVEDAKEIMQEAYAKLLALNRPGAMSLLAGYLWRTAVNLAMDQWRERAQRDRFWRSARALEKQEEFSAESTVESQERLAIVQRAIANLPPRCLEAFVLHVLKDLTFAEVGREMGISEQMSRRHVARALEYLQSCLDAADETRITR